MLLKGFKLKKGNNVKLVKMLSVLMSLTLVMCLGIFAYNNFINEEEEVSSVSAAATEIYKSPEGFKFTTDDLVIDRFGHPARYDISASQDGTLFANVIKFPKLEGSSGVISAFPNASSKFGTITHDEEYMLVFTGTGTNMQNFNVIKFRNPYGEDVYASCSLDELVNQNEWVYEDDPDYLDIEGEWGYSLNVVPWLHSLTYEELSKITTGVISKETTGIPGNFLFACLPNLNDVRFDITGGTKKQLVGTLSGMFMRSGIKNIDFDNVDLSGVTSLDWMFENCDNIEEMDLSIFANTSNLHTYAMNEMFGDCDNLKKLDFSSWKLKVGDDYYFNYGFIYGSNNIEFLDLSCFDFVDDWDQSISISSNAKAVVLPYGIDSSKFNVPLSGTWYAYSEDGTKLQINGSDKVTKLIPKGTPDSSGTGKTASYILKSTEINVNLNHLKLGDIVELGRPNDSNLNEKYKWRVVAFSDLDGDENTGTDGKEAPLLMLDDWYSIFDNGSKKVKHTNFDSRAVSAFDSTDFVNTHLDGREDKNGSFDDGEYTPNRYATSDIRKFLNSSCESGLTNYDDGYSQVGPNAISSKGFLANFGDDAAYLREVPIKSISGQAQIDQSMYSGGSFVHEPIGNSDRWSYYNRGFRRFVHMYSDEAVLSYWPKDIVLLYNPSYSFGASSTYEMDKAEAERGKDAYYEVTYDKVFLPSLEDMSEIYINSGNEIEKMLGHTQSNGWNPDRYRKLAKINSDNPNNYDQFHARSFWLRDAGAQTTIGNFVYNLSRNNILQCTNVNRTFYRMTDGGYYSVKMSEVAECFENGYENLFKLNIYKDSYYTKGSEVTSTDGTSKNVSVERLRTGIVPCCYLKENTLLSYNGLCGGYKVSSLRPDNEDFAKPITLENKWEGITKTNQMKPGVYVENEGGATITQVGYQVASNSSFSSVYCEHKETTIDNPTISQKFVFDTEDDAIVKAKLNKRGTYYVRSFVRSTVGTETKTFYGTPYKITLGKPVINNKWGIYGSTSEDGAMTFNFRVLSLMGTDPEYLKLIGTSISNSNTDKTWWSYHSGGQAVVTLYDLSKYKDASLTGTFFNIKDASGYASTISKDIDKSTIRESTVDDPVLSTIRVEGDYYNSCRYLFWITTVYKNDKGLPTSTIWNYHASADKTSTKTDSPKLYSYWEKEELRSHYYNYAQVYTGASTQKNRTIDMCKDIGCLLLMDTGNELTMVSDYRSLYHQQSGNATTYVDYFMFDNPLVSDEEDTYAIHEYDKFGELGPVTSDTTWHQDKKYAFEFYVQERYWYGSDYGIYFENVPQDFFRPAVNTYGQVITNDAFAGTEGPDGEKINDDKIKVIVWYPRIKKNTYLSSSTISNDLNGNPASWDISKSGDGSVIANIYPNTNNSSKSTLVITEGELVRGGDSGEKIEFTHYIKNGQVVPLDPNNHELDGLTKNDILNSSSGWKYNEDGKSGVIVPWTLYYDSSKIISGVILDTFFEDYSGLFAGLTNLSTVTIDEFGTNLHRTPSNVTGMFKECSSLTSLDLSNFDFSNITDGSKVVDCFNGTSTLEEVKLPIDVPTGIQISLNSSEGFYAFDSDNKRIDSLGIINNLFKNGLQGAKTIKSVASNKPFEFVDKNGCVYTEADIYEVKDGDNQVGYTGPARWNISKNKSDDLWAFAFERKDPDNDGEVIPGEFIVVIWGSANNARQFTCSYSSVSGGTVTGNSVTNYNMTRTSSGPEYTYCLPWTLYIDKTKVTEFGVSENVNCDHWDGWFFDLPNLRDVKIELKDNMKKTPQTLIGTFSKTNINGFGDLLDKIDTSGVTSMRNCFSGSSYTSIPLDKIKTDSLQEAYYMFSYASITEFDTSDLNWDLTNCTTFERFLYNSNVKMIDLSGCKNTGNISNLAYAFGYCSNLESINFGDDFETDNLENMNMTFYYSENLTQIDFGDSFNLVKPVNMTQTFAYTKLSNIDLNDLGTNITPSKFVQTFYRLSNTRVTIDLSPLDLSGLDQNNCKDLFISSDIKKIILPKKLPSGYDVSLNNNLDNYIANSSGEDVKSLGTNGKVTKLYEKGGELNLKYIYSLSFNDILLASINAATSDKQIKDLLEAKTNSKMALQIIDTKGEAYSKYNSYSFYTSDKKMLMNYIWICLKELREENSIGYLSIDDLLEDIYYGLSDDYGEKIYVEKIDANYNEKAYFTIGGHLEKNTDKLLVALDYDPDYILHEINWGNTSTPMVIKRPDGLNIEKSFKDSELFGTDTYYIKWVEVSIIPTEEYIIEFINNAEDDWTLDDLFYYNTNEIMEIINSYVDTGFDYSNTDLFNKIKVVNYLWVRKNKTPYTSVAEIAQDIKAANDFYPQFMINKQTGTAYVVKDTNAKFSLESTDDSNEILDLFTSNFITKEQVKTSFTIEDVYETSGHTINNFEEVWSDEYSRTFANVYKLNNEDTYTSRLKASIILPQDAVVTRIGTKVYEPSSSYYFSFNSYYSGQNEHYYSHKNGTSTSDVKRKAKATEGSIEDGKTQWTLSPTGTEHIVDNSLLSKSLSLYNYTTDAGKVYNIQITYTQDPGFGDYLAEDIPGGAKKGEAPLGDSRIYVNVPNVEYDLYSSIEDFNETDSTLLASEDKEDVYYAKVGFKNSAYAERKNFTLLLDGVELKTTNVSLDEDDFTFPENTTFTYDGNAHYIIETLNPEKLGVEYEAVYHKGTADGEVISKEDIKNVGTYYLVITVNPNVVGPGSVTSWSKEFSIVQKQMNSIAVDDSSTLTAEYTGSDIDPSSGFVIKDGDNTLDPSTYTVTYKDSDGNTVTYPKEIGEYTVIITDNTGNYSGTKEFTFIVVPKQITITDDMFDTNQNLVLEKVYDGLDSYTFDETVNVEGVDVPITVNVKFNDKNVGDEKQVTITVSFKNTSDQSKYGFSKTQITGKTGKITPKTVNWEAAVNDKVYDGTTNITPSDITINTNDFIQGDNVSISKSGSYANKKAGNNKHIDLTLSLNGADKGNYTISSGSIETGKITTRKLDYTVQVGNKSFDNSIDIKAKTTVNITDGIQGSDDVSISVVSAKFKNADKGQNKDVDVVLELAGDDRENYYIIQPTGLKANITSTIVKLVFNTPISKEYDGTKDGAGLVTIKKITKEDGTVLDIPVKLSSITFDDKNAGQDKNVYIVPEFENEGDKENYSFEMTKYTLTNGEITKKQLEFNISVTSKTYDGERTATGVAVKNSFQGLVSGDNPNITLTNGQFASKDAGDNITVTFDASIDDGNYQISSRVSGNGTIKKKDLHIDATTDDGEYDEGDIIDVHFALRTSDLVTGESAGISQNSGTGVVQADGTRKVKKVTIDTWPNLTGASSVLKNYNEVHSECVVNLTRINLDNERLEITITTRKNYDGSPVEVNVLIRYPELGITLHEGTDFTFDYLDDHTDIGTHQIKIEFIGEYKGSKIVDFEIKEKKTPIPPSGGGGGGGGGGSVTPSGPTYTIIPEVDLKAIHKSYMNGYEDMTFKPQNAISREEVATIVARLHDEFNEDYNFTSFNDFEDADDRWSKNYIGFCKMKDLVHGYEDGSFHPTSLMTRAELATLVNNFLRVQNANFEDVDLNKAAFSDVDGRWYEESVNKLAHLGILNGYEDGTFKGDNPVTRIEVAIVMNKINHRNVTKDIPEEYKNKVTSMFKDVTKDRWFFNDVAEAVVDHSIDLY